MSMALEACVLAQRAACAGFIQKLIVLLLYTITTACPRTARSKLAVY